MQCFVLETNSATAGLPYMCLSCKIGSKFLIEFDRILAPLLHFRSVFLDRQIMHKSNPDSVFLFWALIKRDSSIPKKELICRS